MTSENDISSQPSDPTPVRGPRSRPSVQSRVADVTGHRRSFWDLGWLPTIFILGMAGVLSMIVIGQVTTVASTLAGERATAVVVAHREQRSRGGPVTYFPVFRFITADDEVVEVTSHTGWGWKDPMLGEAIVVAYPATRPREADIVGYGLFINAAFFALFAIPLLVFGLASLRAGLRRARAARERSV